MRYRINDDDLGDWIKHIKETKYYDIDHSLQYVVEEIEASMDEFNKIREADNLAVELLKRVARLLEKSTDIHHVNAVYTTPAQALRDQALEIEARDRIIDEIREFLRNK